MFQTGSGTDVPAAGSSSFTYGGKDSLNPADIDFVSSQKALSDYSNNVLKAFTQTRERISEIQTSIADATPNVRRLGGEIKDVSEIITQVAVASRRNVIATTEEVEKLFAIEKVLGLGADVLSNSFLDVGLGIEKIPETFEKSIKYIQDIGGNAKTVMKDVSDNMGQMNRFQFEGGVMGLTKMAAQASMLRFSMETTFKLADDVLDPDRAIEVSAAFQRLGVASGNLVDPFQLMNMSINDPSGLQDSLVDISKQFTEFDKETKTFKINPQGVLTLREIEKQTGVSAKELSKMGLAAAELDQRISAVNAAGLTIASEEDKQYLANIAKMDSKTGTYKVTLEDGTTEELSKLNQEEFNKLIDEQKNAPKTLEDTAKASLRLDEITTKNIQAIKETIVGGVLTADPLQRLNEGIREVTTDVLGVISKEFTTDDTRKAATKVLGGKEGLEASLTKILAEGNFNPQTIYEELISSQAENLAGVGKETLAGIGDISVKISTLLKEKLPEFLSSPSPSTTTASPTTTTSSYTGPITVDGPTGVNPNFSRGAVPASPQKPIKIEQDVNVNFENPPPNLTPDQINKIIQEAIKNMKMVLNEQAFKNYMFDPSKVYE